MSGACLFSPAARYRTRCGCSLRTVCRSSCTDNERSRTACIYSRKYSVPSLFLLDKSKANNVIPEAAEVAGETDLRILHLSLPCLAAELEHNLVRLSDTGCTDRMPFRFQPARGVDGNAPANFGLPFFQRA